MRRFPETTLYDLPGNRSPAPRAPRVPRAKSRRRRLSARRNALRHLIQQMAERHFGYRPIGGFCRIEQAGPEPRHGVADHADDYQPLRDDPEDRADGDLAVNTA